MGIYHPQLSVLQVMMYRATSPELAILSAKCRIISSANKGWLTKVADAKPGHLVSSAKPASRPVFILQTQGDPPSGVVCRMGLLLFVVKGFSPKKSRNRIETGFF